ncbi:MAG: exosortase/archaeosortase family protein [Chitinophagaceae bacterium]|nr:MAG: exosortase/archaeosortase family protein [Chitinophagaceae bacterium]
MLSNISSSVNRFLDTSYSLKFLLRLFALYLLFRLINWLWVALITPEGYYSSVIDNYFDYVTPLKLSLLHTGSFLANLLGVPSALLGDSVLRVQNGGQLIMAWACCGLEIMSFWAAFALADTTPLKTKLYWCFGGLLSIWIINSLRIALLIIAKQNKWQEMLDLDQHDLFNFIAYGFVFLLMFIYYKKNKRELGR